MSVTIWHNPRCTKSRQTLKLLRDRGYDPTIVEYLKRAPSVVEIAEAAKLLGLSPREMMRTSEDAYRVSDLKNETDDEALIRAMSEEPILIERPIVFSKEQARIGRPPEKVLEIV